MSSKSRTKTLCVVHKLDVVLKVDAESPKSHELAAFNQGVVGILAAGKGTSSWKIHPDSDQFLHVLDGDVEFTVLNDDREDDIQVEAGSFLVVPKGHWYRLHVSKRAKVLFVTPGQTDYSEDSDPRKSRRSSSKVGQAKNAGAQIELTIPEQVRQVALSFPETHEDHPWGYPAFKVKNKMFVCMSFRENGINLTVKLTRSQMQALALPFVKMSGYGLGEHGWVTAELKKGETRLPIQVIRQWIEESFRAVAPKTILKQHDLDDDSVVVVKKARSNGRAGGSSQAKTKATRLTTETKARPAARAISKTPKR